MFPRLSSNPALKQSSCLSPPGFWGYKHGPLNPTELIITYCCLIYRVPAEELGKEEWKRLFPTVMFFIQQTLATNPLSSYTICKYFPQPGNLFCFSWQYPMRCKCFLVILRQDYQIFLLSQPTDVESKKLYLTQGHYILLQYFLLGPLKFLVHNWIYGHIEVTWCVVCSKSPPASYCRRDATAQPTLKVFFPPLHCLDTFLQNHQLCSQTINKEQSLKTPTSSSLNSLPSYKN